MNKGFFLFPLAFLLPLAVHANENVRCFGLDQLLGQSWQMTDTPDDGKLQLSRIVGGNPGLSLKEEVLKRKPQQTILLKGANMYRVGLVDGQTVFRYGEKERLSEAFAQTTDAGKKDSVVYGKYYNYDWPQGRCRATRVSVRDRFQLGEAKGIVFDAEVCKLLRDKAGLDPKQSEACTRSLSAIYQKLQEYDAGLRKKSGDKEMLVTLGLVDGSVRPVKGLVDGGLALSFMASCAAYFEMEKKKPEAQPEPGGLPGGKPAD